MLTKKQKNSLTNIMTFLIPVHFQESVDLEKKIVNLTVRLKISKPGFMV